MIVINISNRQKLKLNIDDFQLPERIKKFLQKNQEKVWLVGGAARDKLLGREPRDYDFLVTNVNEKDLAQLLPAAEKVGQSFPVYLWRRAEFSWTTEQRPDQELKRRDFTVNALAAGLSDGKIIDPAAGLQDLAEGLIRPLPGALEADPHRYYRALRFLAQFSEFDLTGECWQKLRNLHKNRIENIAVERVAEEFKIVLSASRGERFFYALSELEGLNHHFFWLKDSLPDSVKRWRTAYCLTEKEKLLFIALALNTRAATESENIRQYLPLAQKWYNAASIASKSVPAIKKWRSISGEKLARAYEGMKEGVLSPAEVIFIATVCDLSEKNINKVLQHNYYQNLEEMWQRMSEEINGADLLEIMEPGPGLGQELINRRSEWIEKNRDNYS